MSESTRQIIFDVPSEAALLGALRARFPDRDFASQPDWKLPEEPYLPSVAVWYWQGTAEALALNAGEILRGFIHPLVSSDQPFVVALPFGRGVFLPASLDLASVERLDLEDMGRLLLDNSADTTLELLPQLKDRLALTPIERQLAEALAGVGVAAEPQVKLGRLRADFLVEHQGRRVVVEADGVGYHDAVADARRDQTLLALGIERVFRFTGSQIYRGPEACALAVRQYLEGALPQASYPADAQLDPSQASAARHARGAARVLAPAGAGKTKTMVARVLELLRKGVPPGSILVLAFNKKASDQLQLRLSHLGVPLTRDLVPYSEGVFCATFNAFGHRYQTQILQQPPRIETDQGQWRNIMEHALADADIRIGDSKPVRGSDPLGRFLKALDRVKADLQAPDQVQVEIESFGDGGNPVFDFDPVFAAFQRRQLSAGIHSFDDQLYITIRDLLQNADRRRMMQDRFEHVLVDEFQDLNATQLALVDILSRPYRNLFVVGDDDQLIYGWRFARLSNILDFHDRVPPKPYSATYTLSTNYRCSRAIVETSRRLIDRNQRREPKDFRAASDAPSGVVRFYPSPSWHARATEIARFLRSERARLDCKWQHLAVLCRYKSQQPLVAMALDAEGIPRSPLLKYRLYTEKAALMLRAYLDLVLDPADAPGDLFGLILNRPNRFLKQPDVDRIVASPNPWDMLREWRDVEHLAPRTVSAFLRTTEVLHAQVSSLSSGELLESIIREFDLERFWTDQIRRGTGLEQDDADPLQVVRLLRMPAGDFPNLQAFLSQWDAMREREIQRNDVQDDELVREEPESDDHVVIGTIHSAKGREYHGVVLVDYDPDLDRLGDAEREEERRVLYVGVTRARQSLLLTIDERKPVNLLVKELIKPQTARDEERSVRERIAAGRDEALRLAAEAERHREEIRAVEEGREMVRLSDILHRQREGVLAVDQAIQAVCFEYEGLRSGGSPPIGPEAPERLRESLRAARGQLSRITSAEDALTGEQSAARAAGGWSPSSDREQVRWEEELDQLRQRTFALGREADHLYHSQRQEGWRITWERLSGKHARMEQHRQRVMEERDSLMRRQAAMLQLRDITDALTQRGRERRVVKAEVDRWERQVALCESLLRLQAERARREAEVRVTEDRLNVLRSRPELLLEDLRSKVRGTKQQVAQVESDLAASESRLIELSLLGS